LNSNNRSSSASLFAFVEAGGRLIEDQPAWTFLGERLGDLDQLLLADAENW